MNSAFAPTRGDFGRRDRRRSTEAANQSTASRCQAEEQEVAQIEAGLRDGKARQILLAAASEFVVIAADRRRLAFDTDSRQFLGIIGDGEIRLRDYQTTGAAALQVSGVQGQRAQVNKKTLLVMVPCDRNHGAIGTLFALSCDGDPRLLQQQSMKDCAIFGFHAKATKRGLRVVVDEKLARTAQ